MLRRLKAYNRPGSGLSKTVINHTRKWLRVKLKLNQVAKLQKSKRSCSHEEQSPESPVSKLRHDGMRHANKTTVKALQLVSNISHYIERSKGPMHTSVDETVWRDFMLLRFFLSFQPCYRVLRLRIVVILF